MRYRVTHRTRYAYSQAVSVCHNLLHLRPRPCPHQRAARTVLAIDPPPAILTEREDVFGNPTTFAIVQELHRALAVEAVTEVDLEPTPPPAPSQAPWEEVRDRLREGRDVDGLARYQLTFDSPLVVASDALRDYAATSFPPGRPLLEAALDLSSRIHRDLAYRPGATTVATTPAETLRLGQGVCQDFAHLAIGCLRAFGLAARYVSGYLVTGRTATSAAATLAGADASHAWLGVWLPDVGWVDLDPTNDLVPQDRHLTVAWGRDYGDVSPIRGVILGGGEHAVQVAVEVAAL